MADEGDAEAKEILEDDPLAQEEEEELAFTRFAFGPFLALALVEFILFGAEIKEIALEKFYM